MRYWLLLTLALLAIAAEAQVKIETGRKNIARNEAFTVAIVVEGGDDLKSYSAFPNINGFRKAGTSSSTTTSFINGRTSYRHTVTQNYMPEREGTFSYPTIRMQINGEEASAPGGTIVVGPPTQARRRRGFGNPFDDFFGTQEKQEYVDVKAKAFLALTTNKPAVYVGEGFTTTLALYIAEDNRADLQFHQLGAQFGDIVQKIKPPNCWEENFDIEQVEGRRITLNGEGYKQYRLFQATYFPLNDEDIVFPSVGLKMIKYKVARNPSFFGRNRQEDFQTFYTQERRVAVKPLPPHPLRDQVSVGTFRLSEEISAQTVDAGESVDYQFQVRGEGNIAAINAPEVPEQRNIDFYPPNVRQAVNRSNGRVTGYKAFSYFAVPQEPGTYNMNDYFRWVYFDPTRARYDTLRAAASLVVTGESQRNQYIGANARDEFYSLIDSASNRLLRVERSGGYRMALNGAVAMLLLTAVGFVFLVKRRDG